MPDLTLSHLIHKVSTEKVSVHIRNSKSGYVMTHIIAHDNTEYYVKKKFKIFIIHTTLLSVKVKDLERASTSSTHGG
jgi:hypothetical protein